MGHDPTAGPKRRPARVADEIRRVLADLLLRRVRDPRVSAIAITDVEVTADLRLARVFYTMSGDEQARAEVAKGLRRATGFLRRELSSRIRLRYMPNLEFHYDESLDVGERVDSLLADLIPQTAPEDEGDDPEVPDSEDMEQW